MSSLNARNREFDRRPSYFLSLSGLGGREGDGQALMLAQRVFSHPPTPGAPRRTDYLAEGLHSTAACRPTCDGWKASELVPHSRLVEVHHMCYTSFRL